jgi:hypothetical protein
MLAILDCKINLQTKPAQPHQQSIEWMADLNISSRVGQVLSDG